MIFKDINYTIQSIQEFDIKEDRLAALHQIIKYIKSTLNPKINFICTHNSRRSILAQIWSHVLAEYFQVPFQSFSGGIEVTKIYPEIIYSLEKNGFKVDVEMDTVNPKYKIFYSRNKSPIIVFSKMYNDEVNSSNQFLAVLTCDHISNNCPNIRNTTQKINLYYSDPKKYDYTELQETEYEKCNLIIASEMYYVFSKI